MKVRHDGKAWEVLGVVDLDGDDAYELARPGESNIVARTYECKLVKAQVRKLRGAKHVLEFHPDGTLRVRRVRSPRRYPVTLEAIYELAVRLQVFKSGRVPKSLRARKGRR